MRHERELRDDLRLSREPLVRRNSTVASPDIMPATMVLDRHRVKDPVALTHRRNGDAVERHPRAVEPLLHLLKHRPLAEPDQAGNEVLSKDLRQPVGLPPLRNILSNRRNDDDDLWREFKERPNLASRRLAGKRPKLLLEATMGRCRLVGRCNVLPLGELSELDLHDQFLGLARGLRVELIVEHVPKILIRPERRGIIAARCASANEGAAGRLMRRIQVEERNGGFLDLLEIGPRIAEHGLQHGPQFIMKLLAPFAYPGREGLGQKLSTLEKPLG